MQSMTAVCARCGYVGANSAHLVRHLSRKKACCASTPDAPSVAALLREVRDNTSEKAFPCAECDKLFASERSAAQHWNRKHATQSFEAKIAALHATVEELRSAVQASSVATTIAHSHNTTQHSHNNTTNNNHTTNINVTVPNNGSVSVLPFGREETAYLHDTEFLNKCLRRTTTGLVEFLEAKHFSPEHPENRNLRATNVKLPYVQVMGDRNTWELRDKKDTLTRQVEDAMNTMQDHYDDINENGTAQDVLRSKIAEVRRFISALEDEEKRAKLRKTVNKEVFLVVVNHTRACEV